jgi:glycosyltransferase involved in cell wall biosynthesis
MRVLAFTKYASLAASTRQRFMQFEPALAAAGIAVDYSPLLDNSYLRALVEGRRASPLSITKSYARRAFKIFNVRSYDLLWVHCEYFPYLPGLVEAWSASVASVPFIFDYDDAIFHMYDTARNPFTRMLLGGKLEPLLERAKACLCGNEYLRAYAAKHNGNAVVVPTVVDTNVYTPVRRLSEQPVTIGWIGSPSTWNYVRPLLPILAQLCETRGIRVLAVGAGNAAQNDRFPGLDLADWSEEAEVELVQSMDIGIMPLNDDRWARGKSGYKLIQYMACGLPVIASPVGVNVEIVSNGENGILATSAAEWRAVFDTLLSDSALRQAMGARGRERVLADYSLKVHAPRVIEILRAAAGR